MQDKLDLPNNEKTEALTRIEIVLAYLYQDMSILGSLKKDEVIPDVNIKGIKWHCMSCGHTWEGHVKINPDIPKACASCKSPYWNEPPRSGKGNHDVTKCALCQKIIERKKEAFEQLKNLSNS